MRIPVFRYLAKLPWTVPNLLITLAAGIAQGFGLALFVPLLKLMNGDKNELTFPFSIIREAFSMIGLTFDFPVVLFAVVTLIVSGLALSFAQRSLLMAYSFIQFVRETNDAVVSSLLQASWSHISKQATGTIINQLMIEVMRAGRALTHLLVALAAAIQVGIFLTISLMLSPKLLIVAIIFGIGTVLVIRPFHRRAYVYGEELTAARKDFGFYTVDFVKNLKLVKATSSENRVGERIKQLWSNVCQVIAAQQINLEVTHFITQAMPVLLVALLIGIGSLIFGTDTTTTLVFLLFLARMAPLLTQFQLEYQAYVMEIPALHVIDAVIAENRAHQEKKLPESKQFTRLTKGIRFENVSYRFPGAETATVEGINLTIGRSAIVAVVGRSGAGKSTMVDLLCGLRKPTQGRILVDGEDLANIDPFSWRKKIGYVTQDIVVFNDTFRNNILFAHPEATGAAIQQAVDIAYLREVVESLPQGFDTIMGEGGVRLSGGQKQRLALARALVGNPQLLLLDEATSALDNESERLIQQAIDTIAHKFTIVVVAHRLSTVRKADLICVMEKGKIVETGTYDELLANESYFSQLHSLQFA